MSQRVAILGATGHVGKCITAALLADGRHSVTAVARNAPRLAAFLSTRADGAACAVRSFDDFGVDEYDAVVNCVGVGTPGAVAEVGAGIFEITEHFDSLVLDYQGQHPGTRYISFSSGAAYCGDFAEPALETTSAAVAINAIAPTDYYGVAKLASEVKHRAMGDRPIVDLRLFGLFSRFVDLDARFFMTDVFRAIVAHDRLVVGPEDIIRDYVDPADMCALLLAVLEAEPLNDVFDLYSALPVAKFEVLANFGERYELTYDVVDVPTGVAATGTKLNYYSTNRRAERLGYAPTCSSIDSLVKEIDVLLEQQGGESRE